MEEKWDMAGRRGEGGKETPLTWFSHYPGDLNGKRVINGR